MAFAINPLSETNDVRLVQVKFGILIHLHRLRTDIYSTFHATSPFGVPLYLPSHAGNGVDEREKANDDLISYLSTA